MNGMIPVTSLLYIIPLSMLAGVGIFAVLLAVLYGDD